MGDNRYLGFATFVFISCFLVLGITAAADSSNCSRFTDPGIVLAKCLTYIKKSGPQFEPSNDCCAVMKIGNVVQCLCQKPPPKFETIVSMEKFVHAATTCGAQTPPPGQNCGSYTIPSSPPTPTPVQPSPIPRSPAPIRPPPPTPRSPVPRPPRRSPPRRRSPPLP
ncbi:sulfated surface glycoprotein 185 [Lathyrus oleraceus]|uniref:Bifunctional inhibitor/plant lipid transfer protein/seed storage helical domain-containing protein n=1 Tax=Pisum sativum TaxID=3888 RepID=A0A9D5AXM6_PEA|nr:sulfated surface glycoprotein 185-like [Pisum sativum]KAI5428032.1 hypothetical protein KIW84_033156 [Pisum sativum]